MAESSKRRAGRPRLDEEGERRSRDERLDRWTRKTYSGHWMWEGDDPYRQPTTRRYKGKEWPVLVTSVRYDDDKRKAIYISAAREMYRKETGHEVDVHVSMVTRCGEPLCVRPDVGHCWPLLLLPGGGRAWGLTEEDVSPYIQMGNALAPGPGWSLRRGEPLEVNGKVYLLEPVFKEYGYTKMRNPLQRESLIEEDPRPFEPGLPDDEDNAMFEKLGEVEYIKYYQRKYRSRHGEWD